MIRLLRNLAGIQITDEHYWSKMTVDAALSRIKTYRTDFSNSNDRTLQNEEFTDIWEKIEDVRRPF